MASTAPRTRKCRRCSGTGYVQTQAMHRGIPGLCMSCDGSGATRVRTADEIAAGRVAAEFSRRACAARAALRPVIAELAFDAQWAAEDGLAALEADAPERFAKLVASVERGKIAEVVSSLIAYGSKES